MSHVDAVSGNARQRPWSLRATTCCVQLSILLSRSTRWTTRANRRPLWSRTRASRAAGRARLSLCLSSALKSTDREENQELQGFLRYPYQVKDMIEHNSYCKEKECVIRIQMEGHPFATALYRARTGDKKSLSSGFRWKVTLL